VFWCILRGTLRGVRPGVWVFTQSRERCLRPMWLGSWFSRRLLLLCRPGESAWSATRASLGPPQGRSVESGREPLRETPWHY